MTRETFNKARELLQDIHYLERFIEWLNRFGDKDFMDASDYSIKFPPGLIQMQKQERLIWLQSELLNKEKELEKL